MTMTDQSTALATREHEGEIEPEAQPRQERALARPAPQRGGMELRQSADVRELLRAFARAQMAFPTIVKNRRADIRPGFSYNYANLADVQNAVNPVLHAHGLVFTMTPTGSRLVGTLFHEPSGQWREGDLPIVLPDARGGAQALGSALTYLMRYLMRSMLNLVLDDFDDDGAAAQAYTPAAAAKAPARPPTPEEIAAMDADACDEVIRKASKRAPLRAHAYRRLIAVADTSKRVAAVVTRVDADAGLPEEFKAKLALAADERAAALADATRAEQPAADDYADADERQPGGDG